MADALHRPEQDNLLDEHDEPFDDGCSEESTEDSSALSSNREFLLYPLFVFIVVAYPMLFSGRLPPGLRHYQFGVVLSVAVMAYLHYRQNIQQKGGRAATTTRQPVRDLPTAMVLGLLAKFVSLCLGVIGYVTLQSFKLELANPHSNTPLSVGQLTIRAFVVSLLFIGITEEMVKFFWLLTYDDDTGSTARRALKIYHPMGIVLLSTAVSLGSTGFNVLASAYAPDHLLPFYYAYTGVLLEVVMNTATGLFVGVGVARRLFMSSQQPAWSIMLAPMLMRFAFFFALMLPLRCRSLGAEEEQTKHLFQGFQGEFFRLTHNTSPVDIGAAYSLVYVFNGALSFVMCFAAWHRVQELEDELESPSGLHDRDGL